MHPSQRPGGSENPYGYFAKKGANDAYVATLINPRDRRPYMITRHNLGVSVSYPQDDDAILRVVGEGYYGKRDESWEHCPRTHTPSGVVEQGVGLGNMLYFGLAVAVAADWNADKWWWKDKDFQEVPCVSSITNQRSSKAEAWWQQAHKRGDAELMEGEEECEDHTARLRLSASEDDYPSDEGRIDSYQDEFVVDGDYRVCKSTEAYTIDSIRAFDAGLVLHWGAWPGLVKLARKHFGEKHPRPPGVPAKILANLDMRAVKSPGLIAMCLNDMIVSGDVDSDTIRKWRMRNVPPWFEGQVDTWPQPMLQSFQTQEPLKGRSPRRAKNPEAGPIFDPKVWREAYGNSNDWSA